MDISWYKKPRHSFALRIFTILTLSALLYVSLIRPMRININKDFYVFTGSTVGIVPILGKGLYTGKIDKLEMMNCLLSKS